MVRVIALVALVSCSSGDKKPVGPTSPPVSITDLELGGVRSIGELAAVARDPASAQRTDAIRGLARVGDDRAVEALVAIAGDGDAKVRLAVASALGVSAQMGASGEPIARALVDRWTAESDPDVKRALAIALGRSGQGVAVEHLTGGLADSRTEVVKAAALALGLLGRKQVGLDDAARAALVELAGSSTHRYEATYALAREHQPAVDPVSLRVLEALVADPDPEIRALALTGLARRRRGRPQFAAAFADKDWRVAVAAISGVGELKWDAATNDLASWLRDVDPTEVNPTVLRAALRVLIDRADVGSARTAARALRSKLSATGSTDLDLAQIDCLANAVRVRAGSIAGVTQCGKAAPMWWRRVLAAEVLAKTKRPPADRMQMLESLLNDRDARVRAAAISGIGKVWSPELSDRVAAAMAKGLGDNSVAVAGTAADSIGPLRLSDQQKQPLHTLIAERASRELDGDAELGLTLVNAITANTIAAGLPACRKAHNHRNRTARVAGRACIKALTREDPGPGDPGAVARPPHAPSTNNALSWTVTTSRGDLVIELRPSAAPWHVAALAGLTRAGFYDGLLFHRVVPGFVTQGGDPTGTGWGGPDFVLPPEPSDAPFDRGVVGIADAGPGTGGSQWFITHARAPHLEGRYTVVGAVTSGIEVVDKLAVGDRIVKATIAP